MQTFSERQLRFGQLKIIFSTIKWSIVTVVNIELVVLIKNLIDDVYKSVLLKNCLMDEKNIGNMIIAKSFILNT